MKVTINKPLPAATVPSRITVTLRDGKIGTLATRVLHRNIIRKIFDAIVDWLLGREWVVHDTKAAGAAMKFKVDRTSFKAGAPFKLLGSHGNGHCLYHSIQQAIEGKKLSTSAQHEAAQKHLTAIAALVHEKVACLRKIANAPKHVLREGLTPTQTGAVIDRILEKSEQRGGLNKEMQETRLSLDKKLDFLVEHEPIWATAALLRTKKHPDQERAIRFAENIERYMAQLTAIRQRIVAWKFDSRSRTPAAVLEHIDNPEAYARITTETPSFAAFEEAANIYISGVQAAATGSKARLWGDGMEIALLEEALEVNIAVHETNAAAGYPLRHRERFEQPHKKIIHIAHNGNHYESLIPIN